MSNELAYQAQSLHEKFSRGANNQQVNTIPVDLTQQTRVLEFYKQLTSFKKAHHLNLHAKLQENEIIFNFIVRREKRLRLSRTFC